MCEDAEYLIVGFGISARIGQKAAEMAREEGLKVGLLRPITLFPFPTNEINRLAKQVKGILTVELVQDRWWTTFDWLLTEKFR